MDKKSYKTILSIIVVVITIGIIVSSQISESDKNEMKEQQHIDFKKYLGEKISFRNFLPPLR